MPQISVILPNYNHAPFLKERIESIINQTFTGFELIILDDASTDGSRNIIRQYENHPKVTKIEYGLQNSGSPFIQWNKGVELASGEWIWIAESDDVAEKDMLAQLYLLITEKSEVVLAYCQSDKMDKNGNITGTWKTSTDDLDATLFEHDFVMGGMEYVDKFLIRKNTIPNASAVLFRKSAFFSVGRTDEDVKNCSDWLLWLKMAMRGNIAFCASSLNHFRYSDTSVIALAVKTKKVDFFKKYDIAMRHRFDRFLRKQGHRLHPIRKANRMQMALEMAHECRWLLAKNKKREMFHYFVRYLLLCFASPSQAIPICMETIKLFRIFK